MTFRSKQTSPNVRPKTIVSFLSGSRMKLHKDLTIHWVHRKWINQDRIVPNRRIGPETIVVFPFFFKTPSNTTIVHERPCSHILYMVYWYHANEYPELNFSRPQGRNKMCEVHSVAILLWYGTEALATQFPPSVVWLNRLQSLFYVIPRVRMTSKIDEASVTHTCVWQDVKVARLPLVAIVRECRWSAWCI